MCHLFIVILLSLTTKTVPLPMGKELTFTSYYSTTRARDTCSHCMYNRTCTCVCMSLFRRQDGGDQSVLQRMIADPLPIALGVFIGHTTGTLAPLKLAKMVKFG